MASEVSSLVANADGPRPSPRSRTPDCRFQLVGPSATLDPRTHAVRRDVADIALAKHVFAPHYALPLDHGCLAIATPIKSSPSNEAAAVSELLRGETFAVVDASGEWAWGYGLHDGYVGYIAVAALGMVIAASHVVSVPAALLFADADIKSPVIERLPMGARLAAAAVHNDFHATDRGFVHRCHLTPIDERLDPVEAATRLTGVPYHWGGRSGDGIDCSGLIQLALGFAGIAAPRDSDQQQALGEPLGDSEKLRRGDLVFMPGHVGIMADETHLLHANAHWMQVVTEPLAHVVARQPQGSGNVARRRGAW